MAILNLPNNGQLSVLLALWRTVKTLGPLSKEDLLNLCVPPPMRREQARHTLRTWSDLGLFVEDGGVLKLDPKVSKCVSDPVEDPLFSEFGAAAFDIVLRDENNSDLGKEGTEDGGTGAVDFTYAICWMLCQDPHLNWDYARADREQGKLPSGGGEDDSRRPIQNSTRWAPFVDWAGFFGMGWVVDAGSGSFFVDPAEAIRARLPVVFGKEKEISVRTFVQNLTECLPVLHTGRYRLMVESYFPEEDRVVPEELSISLSHALLRLEAEGLISLAYSPDSPSSMRLSSKRKGLTIKDGKSGSITDVRRGGG